MQSRPTPEETRPPLTVRGQLWRLAVCLVFSALLWSEIAVVEWQDHRGFFWAEVVLGVAAYVLVWFRRQAPTTIALTIALMSSLSGIAAGPATLAAVSVATLRRPWPIVAVGVTNFACAQFYTLAAPWQLEQSVWVSVLVNLVVNGAMMGWGMYIGSRREVVWTLRERVRLAEEDQERRVAQARSTERARIAREMHDALAHRITQVSMHAGALGYREDLAADDLRGGLAQIQEQANQALDDLRGILGVLRDDSGQALAGPQPTYRDVAGLVADAAASGMHIEYDDTIAAEHVPMLPDPVGRAVYRIVQEGLTNARKHAPGAHLRIRIGGDPERGIDVAMRNPIGFGSSSTPGAGLGLVGLRERAELRGGRLHHYREGSSFVLQAWIPWSA